MSASHGQKYNDSGKVTFDIPSHSTVMKLAPSWTDGPPVNPFPEVTKQKGLGMDKTNSVVSYIKEGGPASSFNDTFARSNSSDILLATKNPKAKEEKKLKEVKTYYATTSSIPLEKDTSFIVLQNKRDEDHLQVTPYPAKILPK